MILTLADWLSRRPRSYKDATGYLQLDHATGMFAYSTNNVAHEAFYPSTPPAEMAPDLKLLVAGGVSS